MLLRGMRKDSLRMPKCLIEMLTTFERHKALTINFIPAVSLGLGSSNPHRVRVRVSGSANCAQGYKTHSLLFGDAVPSFAATYRNRAITDIVTSLDTEVTDEDRLERPLL